MDDVLARVLRASNASYTKKFPTTIQTIQTTPRRTREERRTTTKLADGEKLRRTEGGKGGFFFFFFFLSSSSSQQREAEYYGRRRRELHKIFIKCFFSLKIEFFFRMTKNFSSSSLYFRLSRSFFFSFSLLLSSTKKNFGRG